MIVLAIDTATAATTVGVLGPGIEMSRTVIDSHGHVESLAPLVDEVLRDSGVDVGTIDVVACGVGPGPFTGLRVGVATAIAWGAVRQVPIVGVGTHDVLARAAVREWLARVDDGPQAAVLVATPARRVECHVSHYDRGGHRVSGPLVLTHDETRVAIEESDAIVAGDAGPLLVADLIDARRGPRYPDAIDLAAIVHERHEAGEEWPQAGDIDIDLDPATTRGESTAAYLDRRFSAGHLLLPARPLYLRQPDAVPSAASEIAR